jgi:hypothetical protein
MRDQTQTGYFDESDEDEHAEWLEKWTAPRCPFGNPQVARRCRGYHEREPECLELRVPLREYEVVCDVIVHEQEDVVQVRVIACYEEPEDGQVNNECWECPAHVYLEKPLNGRAVIDVQTDAVLPAFVPSSPEASDPAEPSDAVDDFAS